MEELTNVAEMDFHKSNDGLYYHPSCFHFNGEKYSPDFYDPATNTFFEIIGTRQRKSQIEKEGKIERFRKAFPHIKLEIYFSFCRNKNRQLRIETPPSNSFEHLLKIARDRGMNKRDFAIYCGIQPTRISEIATGKRKFTGYYFEVLLEGLNLTPEEFVTLQ